MMNFSTIKNKKNMATTKKPMATKGTKPMPTKGTKGKGTKGKGSY